MDFTKIIKSLLITNDRLCIPGLGTFITQYRPAEAVPGMNFMKPPCKTVSFDPDLKTDDGLLSAHIVKYESMDQKEAVKKIETFVSNILERINNDRSFGLLGIGSFTLKNNKVVFTPEVVGNLLADAYGLPDISMTGEASAVKNLEKTQPVQQPVSKPVAPPVPQPEVKKQPEPVKVPPVETPKPQPKPVEKKVDVPKDMPVKVKSGNGIWVLIGIAVPVLLLLIGFFLIFPNSKFYSELNNTKPVSLTGADTLATNAEVEKFIDEQDDQGNALMYKEDSAATETVKTEPVATPANDKYAHCKDFYIIAGSFKQNNLAQRFKSKLNSQGSQAEVLKCGDNYRVYLQHFTNRNEALVELDKLVAEGKNVWLLSI